MGDLEEVEVLVTGATGFIGSHLTRRLVKENAKVNIVSRKEDLDKVLLLKDFARRIRIWKCNLLDQSSLIKCVQRVNPEKIFHLGAFVNTAYSFQVASECVQTNIQGTVNLLTALQYVSYDTFVHAGTCHVYESNSAPFSEEQKIDPISPYAISKTASESFCKFAHEVHGAAVVLLRISTVYGPCQDLRRLVPYVITNCLKRKNIMLTSCDQTRDFTYVDDIVDGIIKSSIIKDALGEVINLGNEKEYSIRFIVAKIIELMGNPVEPTFGALSQRTSEPKRWYCDISRAKRILRWKPKIALNEGLEQTIEWYAKNL